MLVSFRHLIDDKVRKMPPRLTTSTRLLLISARFLSIIYCLFMILLHLIPRINPAIGTLLKISSSLFPTLLFIICLLFHLRGLVYLACTSCFLCGHFKQRLKKLWKAEAEEEEKSVYATTLTKDNEADLTILQKKLDRHNMVMVLGVIFHTYRIYSISTFISSTTMPKLSSIAIATICSTITLYYALNLRKKVSTQLKCVKILLLCEFFLGVIVPLVIVASPLVAVIKNRALATNRDWLVLLIGAVRSFVMTSFGVGLTQIYSLLHVDRMIYRLSELAIKFPSDIRVTPVERDDDIADSFNECKSTDIASLSRSRETMVHRLYITALFYSLTIICVAFTADLKSSCGSKLVSATCSVPTFPWLGQASTCRCLSLNLDCKILQDQKHWNSSEVYDFLNDRLTAYYSDIAIRLQINNCDFPHLPPSLNQMTEVMWLDIFDGQLVDFELDMSTKQDLLALLIVNQPLTQFPSVLRTLPDHLFLLGVSGTNISELPMWNQSDAKGLQLFVSQANPLREFPKQLYNIRTLRSLLLQSNNFTEIPKGIGSLQNLNILRIANNKIESIDPSITNLTALRILTLGTNKLRSVPWSKQQLIEWNEELLESNSQTNNYRMISFPFNPVCEEGEADSLHQLRACLPTCSPVCDRIFQENLECNPACNISACNYDNGVCLT